MIATSDLILWSSWSWPQCWCGSSQLDQVKTEENSIHKGILFAILDYEICGVVDSQRQSASCGKSTGIILTKLIDCQSCTSPKELFVFGGPGLVEHLGLADALADPTSALSLALSHLDLQH